MAKIFSLFGEIFIENEKANKSIEDTTDKAKKSEGGLSKVIGTAGKVGAAVLGGATVAAGALTAMVGKITETTGAIKDSADRAGVTAESYQKWSFAAAQSGMSAETLEKAMIKQQKAFADASTGSKTAQAAYNALGLDVKKIGSSGEAFDLVMNKLADMEDETQKNAIANDIFGKSYAELTPLLNEGSEGMDALKQTAVDLGGVMSNDAVAAGEQLGDTIDQVKTIAMGLFNSLGVSLMPVIQDLADLIINNMPMIQEMFAQIGPALGEFFTKMMPVLMDLAKQLLPVILNVIQQLLPVIVSLMPLLSTIISSFLPPLVELLNMILPPLLDLLNLIIPPLTAVVRVLAKVMGEVLGGAIKGLKPIVEGSKEVFKGLINFIKGDFSVDWDKTWKGLVNQYGTIFKGIGNAAKGPLNFLIDQVNNLIRGLNKIKLPDWMGGFGINIKEIPKLSVGLDYVPYDNFPALLHKGERVMTAAENKAGSTGGITVVIENFVNNRAQDVQDFAEELEYYRVRKAAANGLA